MRPNWMMAGVMVATLAATGCATKKYVGKAIAPVESRVTSTEAKNTDQDKQIAEQGKDLDAVSTDLSRTKERVTDADNKAVAANQAAQQAQQRADGAQQAADGARSFAERGLQRVDQRADQLEKSMSAMNKYNMVKSETVLFKVNQAKLTDEGKAQLDEIAKTVDGHDRYVIEVQGFTDKTGSAAYNEQLSQARAEAVTRYLVNEHKIPVRSINALGSGYALPVADDKTREGRVQNRRVEIRVFVPEMEAGPNTVAATK